MDANELRAMQAPIKDRYKSDAKAAFITLKAKGTLDDTNIACKVETGRALAVAGLHPATGGSGMELCSGDMLLEALVACAGVTVKAVATALDIPLKSGKVSAEGDLDFRGTLGVAKDAPVGFAQIRLRFDLDTDAPQEKLDQLLKLTERYCVVYQTIKAGPPVDVKLARVVARPARAPRSLFRAHPHRQNGRHRRLRAGGDGHRRARRPAGRRRWWRRCRSARGRSTCSSRSITTRISSRRARSTRSPSTPST